MESKTTTTFYVLQEGAVREEPWEWPDIRTMCESGTFTPETLIFFPEDNQWKQAGDTELLALFPVRGESESEVEAVGEALERYNAAVAQTTESPDDWSAHVEAAAIAAEMGDRDQAVGHYQRALDLQPYQPRVALAAKRNLPPQCWKKLRRLERPQLAWEDLGALAGYPMGRGVGFVAFPALALGLVALVPLLNAILLPLTYLVLNQTVFSGARGEKLPPVWTRMFTDPMTLIVKPLIVGVVVSLELAVPFVIVGLTLALVGMAGEKGLVAYMSASPLLVVVAFTLNLVYLPAVFMIVGSGSDPLRAMNPVCVFRTIVTMERDYFTAVGLSLGLAAALGGITFVLSYIPLLGGIWAAGFMLFFIMAEGYVLGTLYHRYEDQLTA